jgi:hypothetical protein
MTPMSASVLPVLVNGLVSAEETRSLPMPPLAYGLIAFAGFLLGLGVLWTFRNSAAKVPPPGRHNDDTFHG